MSSYSEDIMVNASPLEQDDATERKRKVEEDDMLPIQTDSHSEKVGLSSSNFDSDNKPSQCQQPIDTQDCKSCSCSCHTTNTNCIFEEKLTESIKFRELLLLHLDIIEDQNVRLLAKEKQIHNLKSENEQLNARINRMERRVALKVRKHTDDTDADSVKSKTAVPKRGYSFGGTETAKKSKKPANYGTVGVVITSKQNKDTGTGCYLKTDVDYMQLNSYLTAKPKNVQEEKIKIPVPCFKDVPVENLPQGHRPKKSHDKKISEGIDEITDDESYQRRHLKMELDEIRRKRWDIQHLRQERMQENLRQRQREREDPNGTKNQNKIIDKESHYLHPPCSNILAIEVVNEVPVFALGGRIPEIEPSEFDLPWFDVDKREAQIRQRRLKGSRSQRRKTWYKY